MTAGYKLVQLANGAHSVHSLVHGETFHPAIGPVAEAEALYVNQLSLGQRLKDFGGELVIWDVGLGAAANALTVLRAVRELPCTIRLVSFDQTSAPLEFALQHAEALGYFGGYENHIHELLRANQVAFRDGQQSVNWELHLGDFPALLESGTGFQPVQRALQREQSAPASFSLGADRLEACPTLPPPHAILFDPYSPKKNPEMWTLPLFTRLFQLLDPQRHCALPTYSRSTIPRVTLLLAGFFVGVGHATGQKEETTIAANSPQLIAEPLDRKWLARARASHSAEPLSEPVYRQAPLSAASWEKLQAHPQFRP